MTCSAQCVFWLVLFTVCQACSQISGLDDFRVVDTSAVATTCNTHGDCTQRGSGDFCLRASGRCVTLKSAECSKVTGPAADDDALLLGSLFATDGTSAAENNAYERAAMLAIQDINSVGGLTAAHPGGRPRPLVLVSCNTSRGALRPAQHLVQDLGVPAIVGPNDSQEALDVAVRVTIAHDTALLSPNAQAASIADLFDDDLVWQMVPSSVDRGPLLVHELITVQRTLRTARGRDLKLSLIVHDDPVGAETRAALSNLTWNGEQLSAASLSGGRVKVDTYSGTDAVSSALIADHAAFVPDVVVLAGSGNLVSAIAPLEQAWGSAPKPEYVLLDSAKRRPLLALIEANPELARRVRGTGIAPTPESRTVNSSFVLSYRTRFPADDAATSAEVGTSYDAIYAVAYALVAGRGEPSGQTVAQGLRRLGTGDALALSPTKVLAALQRLAAASSIAAQGTHSLLSWDERGAIAQATAEIWCVRMADGTARFVSSGLTADLPAQTLSGENRTCAAQGAAAGVTTDTMELDAGAPAATDAGAREQDAAPEAGGSRPPATPPPTNALPDAGMPDAGPQLSPAPLRRPISCGAAQSCDQSQAQFCCSPTLAGALVCSTKPQGCSLVLYCLSDRECTLGSVCCLDSQFQAYCRSGDACPMSDGHLACDTTQDCPLGQTCCARDPNLGTRESFYCSANCGAGELEVCTGPDPCRPPTVCTYQNAVAAIGFCL
jgi:branched-chain amino acid transport system substrate-binding protein